MEKRKIQCGIIGDAFVGKTTFTQTLRKENIYFREHYYPTIGVDFTTCQIEVDKIPYNITMWDLTGVERFRSIITTYFKTIRVALVCFSYDNLKSIKNLDYWINLIEEQNDDCYIVLLGMKKDRISSINYVGDDVIEQVKKYSYKLYSINNYNYALLSSIMQEIVRDAVFYNKFNSVTIKKNDFFKKKKKKKRSRNIYTRNSDWCCWC